MVTIQSRLMLEGVPRVSVYEGGPRCPEDIPTHPSCALMQYLSEEVDADVPADDGGTMGTQVMIRGNQCVMVEVGFFRCHAQMASASKDGRDSRAFPGGQLHCEKHQNVVKFTKCGQPG